MGTDDGGSAICGAIDCGAIDCGAIDCGAIDCGVPVRLASRTCSAARCASARVRCIASAASIACIRDS